MTSKLERDPRLDPRIKAAFVGVPTGKPQPDVSSREELLAQELSAEGLAVYAHQVAIFDSMDREDIAPSAGLIVRAETFTSAPDGNTVRFSTSARRATETLPCIYYIHGGRMAFSSCYEGNYKAWGRMIAARGLAVAMVDFRNAVHANSAPEIAPFPAGLNDSVSGLKWVRANGASLGIDPARIVVAGESGGGNLALAVGMKLKQDGDLGLIQGDLRYVPLYRRGVAAAAVPFRPRTRASSSRCTTTAAPWPTASTPSTPAIRSPGPPSLSARMSRGCRRW